MELHYLELQGYKRLGHSGITTLRYTPNAPHQLILGTNGCGKSSLMSQLSMLPAIPKDFEEGGFKHWEGSHEGVQYVLRSEIGKKTARHSFKRILANGDVEELNPGGTGAVQKELVFQHCKLTNELMQVLLGRVRFVDMSPAKRAEWCQAIAPVDVTAAMGLYRHHRQHHRAMGDVYKHANGQLQDALGQRMSDEDRIGLDVQIQSVKDDLTHWMEAKIPLPRGGAVPDPQYDRLAALSREILQADFVGDSQYRSYGDIVAAANHQQDILRQHQAVYDQQVLQFYALDKKLQALGAVSDTEIDAQRLRMLALESALAEYPETGYLVEDNQAEIAVGILSDRITELSQALLSLPITKSGYTRETYIQKNESVKRLGQERQAILDQMTHLQMELRRIELTESVVCPSCAVTFKPGVQGDLSSNIKSQLTTLDNQQLAHQASIDALNLDIEEITTWREAVKQIQLLLQGDALTVFREQIIGSPEFTESPVTLIPVVQRWIPQLNLQVERFRKHNEYLQVKANYEIAVALQNSARQQNVQLLNEQYQVLETNIAEALSRVNHSKAEIKRLAGLETAYLSREQLMKQFDTQYQHSVEQQIGLARYQFNARMDELISGGHTQLAFLENRKQQANQTLATIERIQTTMADVVVQGKAAAAIAEVLSPADGIIADQLATSVNAICIALNEVISKVWTYPLEVLPCGLDGSDLNYKFPLRIRGDDNELVDDIEIGSDSQREIINLAFRLVLMDFLDLRDFPLYGDELGREFDETHAPRVMQYLKLLVESQRVSQIFLISHNPLLHSVFTQADVNILHTDNISVAGQYNQFMEIE